LTDALDDQVSADSTGARARGDIAAVCLSVGSPTWKDSIAVVANHVQPAVVHGDHDRRLDPAVTSGPVGAQLAD
jgi:hypothetical protein